MAREQGMDVRVQTWPATRQRRRTGLRAAALLAVLLAAGGGAWQFWGRSLAVVALHPVRGPAIEAVYAAGVVEAIDTARVGTKVAGRVTDLLVDDGDAVKQGQLLAVIDDREARRRLDDARARLDLADQELARDRALLAQHVRPEQAVQRSQAERDRAAAGLKLAADQLADTRIVAPFDGLVMKREVDKGDMLAANAALFTVAVPGRLRVAADVDERDIALVRLGAPVAIRADALPDRPVSATVTNIRPLGDPATRSFRVEANLPPDSGLMVGMTVDVNIVTGERADALLVPAGAVRHGAPQGGRAGPAYVFRVLDGKARRTAVETGAVGEARIEIRAGLDAADLVLADPPDGLADGRAVRVEAR